MATFFLRRIHGGVLYLNKEIIEFKNQNEHTVLGYFTPVDVGNRFTGSFGTKKDVLFEVDIALDNQYYLNKRIVTLIGDDHGALISNDEIDLVAIQQFGTNKTVFQLVHDDWNIKMAEKYENVVDVHICHSEYIYNKLINKLPKKKERIHYLPYGIKFPDIKVDFSDLTNSVNICFCGRLVENKGVRYFKSICEGLIALGIPYSFTIIGKGDYKSVLQKELEPYNVKFYSPDDHSIVMDLMAENHIFLFPTSFEGTPVALVEAMSLGLVPVATLLQDSEIPFLIEDDKGLMFEQGNVDQMIGSIEYLYKNPEAAKKMSDAARKYVHSNFDLQKNFRKYYSKFDQYEELYRPKNGTDRTIKRSRLDSKYIPNQVVRIIRKWRKNVK